MVAPIVLATATFPTEFSPPVSSPPSLSTTLIRRLLARAVLDLYKRSGAPSGRTLARPDRGQRRLRGTSGQSLFLSAAYRGGHSGRPHRRRHSGGLRAGDGARAGPRPIRDREGDPDRPVPSHRPPDTTGVRERPGLRLQRPGKGELAG